VFTFLDACGTAASFKGAQMTNQNTAADVFRRIYDSNEWKSSASVSGPGSSLKVTEKIREELPRLLKKLKIKTLCDAPCGDANWISTITENLDYYFGFDIVPELIIENLARSKKTNHFFRVANIVEDVLPKADAIFCRDCLVHLPLEAGVKAVQNFKSSGAKYLIATTFPTVAKNGQSGYGGWRPLNLQIEPYSLPEPLHLIQERAPNPADKYNDKALGVWRLNDI
jgi:hypothetical protein